MKRHVTIAALVLALAAYSAGKTRHSDSQDSQNQTAQPSAKLSKKERKHLEKEEKKEREHERKAEKQQRDEQAKDDRKQEKKQEERIAKERKQDLKKQEKKITDERKQEEKKVAEERKKEEKHERKEEQRAEEKHAREMNRHVDREERAERAAMERAPRSGFVPHIPVLSTATRGLLMAQRQVGRAIYSQLPGSNVLVLLGGGNQILLRGSAPTPSLRQRLLQLAIEAASGYSVVDQLAAQFVGEAASTATNAAIGGVSDLIHGSRDKESDRESDRQSGTEPPPSYASAAPPPDYSSSAPPPVSSQQALPNRESEAMAGVLEPGSNACVNVHSSGDVVLRGGVSSQSSAELVRRFAHRLSSTSAVVTDQLAVRTAGVPSAGNASQEVASDPGTGITPGESSASNALTQYPTLSPGSTVCVTENNGQLFLTGTVGSTADLGTVENAVQPLVGGGRLLDHLTIASTNSGTAQQATSPASLGAAADTAPPQGGAVATNVAEPTQQSEVEQALHSIPRLSNVNVQVSADGVHLSGSVDTTQDEQMAAEVARQYASGRPVVDNLAVANRTPPSMN